MALLVLQGSSNPVIPSPVQSSFDHITVLDLHIHVLPTIPVGSAQLNKLYRLHYIYTHIDVICTIEAQCLMARMLIHDLL